MHRISYSTMPDSHISALLTTSAGAHFRLNLDLRIVLELDFTGDVATQLTS